MYQKEKLGLFMLTALVAGNMIGSGIFLLPADLANVGSISLFSWCLTATGAFCLAIIFAKLSMVIPKTGGPYAFAHEGFGDFIGFQTAYNYWIALWVGNSAIAIAMVGYLAVFWPALNQEVDKSLVAIFSVWLLTLVNIVGVRTAGMVQLITTILKLIPILLIALFGWFYFHPIYLTQAFNVSHHSNFVALSNATTLTLWAFIGLESATIPASSVKNPTRDIPLATLFGTLIAAVVYIASSTVIMGMIPMHTLSLSTSPFAQAAEIILGKWGNWFIAAGAAISCFGCLNGWILLQGQVPMAIADDHLFPAFFAKRNIHGVPTYGLILTSALITGLLLLTSHHTIVRQFEIIILIAAVTSLLAYLYTAIAALRLLNKHALIYKIVAIVGAIYAFWAIFSSEKNILFYVFILILSSVPLYAFVRPRRKLFRELMGKD